MTNTQFKIGDDIIMTANSGKGGTWNGIEDGEYKGKVIDDSGFHPIMVQLENGRKGSFEKDGSVSLYPGMSIRLAKEEVESTPSQWIEGQPIKEGYYWVECKDNSISAITWTLPRYVPSISKIIRYCPISELPPPPPVKEVEAYGYLEFCNKLTTANNCLNASDVEKILIAKAFYSQLATAKVLEKYVNCMHKIYNYDGTIDQFINWHKEQHSEKLLFTPAALDELGIK